MRTPNLRTQLLLLTGLVWLYSLGFSAAYWRQNRAHARLESGFHQGLTVLSSLPRLRDQLRRVDQSGDQFLLSGQPSWLARRDEALEQVRGLLRELEAAASDERDLATTAEADRRLTAYLAERSPWISRRRAGRLSPDEAAAAARRARELDAVVEALNELKDVNVADLRERRLDAERAARSALRLILLAGAAAAAFVAWLLSRALIGPVAELRRRALDWGLGRPWPAEPPPGAGAEISELHATMGDMARRLNAQFERETELGRLKGSLVSMASHEFNNSLSVLGTTVNLLRQTETAPPAGKREEYYAIVEANLRALSLAVRSLLDLGLLESGKFTVRPGRADLARLLSDGERALRPLHERKGLRFTLELRADLPAAHADPQALSVVVTNLLGNAVKYTPEGGAVRAGASVEPDGRLRVYVADTGIGVDAADREAILVGHRTEEGRQAASGFGVGLTVVKRILDAHGVALEIDGAPGKGSRFSFVLPAWKGPAEELFD
ncbi:MAG: ATP-binding protein [Elusimicrobiota bacterium]|nr:MAG: ATP-binding protein [Elusimicrobiota bacterium]